MYQTPGLPGVFLFLQCAGIQSGLQAFGQCEREDTLEEVRAWILRGRALLAIEAQQAAHLNT